MKVTIPIDNDLLRRARRRASDERVSLRRVVEDALRDYLSPGKKTGGYVFRWEADHGTLQPGVNLEDRDSLFDLMDGLDEPPERSF